MFNNYTKEEKETIKGLRKNIEDFAKSRQRVMRAIKKSMLTIETIKVYEIKLKSFKEFMLLNKDDICKINNTNKDKYVNIVKDIDTQLNWCYQQYNFNKEIKKGRIKK